MNGERVPVVLIVEDEPDVAETYRLWLRDRYEVLVAESAHEGLEKLDGVDVVLLDRMLPGTSGDEFLELARERGFGGGVAMVTAVDPDIDILEMRFDEYVQKPPTREGLRSVVAELVERDEYTDAVREYRSLVAKRAALETSHGRTELADSPAYAALQDRIEAASERVTKSTPPLSDDVAFVDVLRDLTAEGGPNAEPEETGERGETDGEASTEGGDDE